MTPLSPVRRRWRLARLAYSRYVHHFGAAIRTGDKCIGTVAAVAALGCLVLLVLYFGYDHAPADARGLRLALRFCQGGFVTRVIYQLVFSFRSAVASTGAVKWVVQLCLLGTLLAWIYPRPENPWLPWLDTLLYSRAFLFATLCAYAVLELSYGLMSLVSRRTNPSLLLSASFLFFIITGSLVLMLPRCTVAPISYADALFVASSAVSITGLTTVDIPSTFTPAGLAVLAVLIQTGGLGVLTFTSFFALFFSGTTSVYNQLLIRDMMYSRSMNALIPTLLYILAFTLTVELLGAAAVYVAIPAELGLSVGERLVLAGFHSLSSFCNAGFSCLPGGLSNATMMAHGQAVYSVTSVLVFAGAIGFPILVNFKDWAAERLRSLRRRGKPRPLHLFDLNTKLVMTTSLIVLGIGSVGFLALEYDNTLAGMPLGVKINQAVFNALTPRSAGFASVDPAQFLPLTLLLVMVQMWIGGASQSLGGGIKVNTVAAIYLNVRSIVTGRSRSWAYDRTVSIGSIRRANAVVALSIAALVTFLGVELWLEPALPLKAVVFEVVSALFTVGSSLGITAELGDASKAVLSVAMFVGRVGIISLLAGMIGSRRDFSQYLPEENIIIN